MNTYFDIVHLLNITDKFKLSQKKEGSFAFTLTYLIILEVIVRHNTEQGLSLYDVTSICRKAICNDCHNFSRRTNGMDKRMVRCPVLHKIKMVLMGLTLDITLSRSGYVIKILCG